MMKMGDDGDENKNLNKVDVWTLIPFSPPRSFSSNRSSQQYAMPPPEPPLSDVAQSECQVTKLVVEIDDIQSLVAVMASQNGNLSHHSLTCTHTCKS